MSWFEALRRSQVTGFVIVLTLAVAACGFQPLYGRNGANGVSARDEMAQVRIAPIQDRVGQQLHNFLRDRLNPKRQPVSPSYNLQVTLTEQIEELGIRKDETATRANLKVFADFVLRDARTRKTLFEGRSRSFNSYNILDSQFATLFSESDARTRALKEISNDIRNRLAVYFTRIAARPS